MIEIENEWRIRIIFPITLSALLIMIYFSVDFKYTVE